MEAKSNSGNIWEPCNIDQAKYCEDPQNYVEIDQDTLKVSDPFTIKPYGVDEGSTDGSGDDDGPLCSPPDDCGFGCAKYDWSGSAISCECSIGAQLADDGKCVKAEIDSPVNCNPPDECGYGCQEYDWMGAPTGCKCIENSKMSDSGKCLRPDVPDESHESEDAPNEGKFLGS